MEDRSITASDISLLALVAAQRAPELDLREAEAVAQAVGGAGQALEFLAAAPIEQIELLDAVAQRRKFNAEQPYLSPLIPVLGKQLLDCAQDRRVQIGRLGQRLRSRSGVEASVANCEGKRARIQAGLAQAFGSLLAEVAQRGRKRGAVIGVVPKV